MPTISWNEIRNRALNFARSWSSATREQADKQTFWNEFFDVFGISRRMVASFEEPVSRMGGSTGFIDLLWPGKVLVEHKTAGHSLEAAESQAFGYIHDLIASGRQDEVPRYVLLSDFRRFALYDLEPDDQRDLPLFRGVRFHRLEFPLGDLRHHITAFAFLPGYQVHRTTEQDPANLKAVALMARLHDTLKDGGYAGHALERLLVRVLFCLFAEDTGIFDPGAFGLYIENRTHKDGSDLGVRLAQLFQVLDTPVERRQRNLDESLAALPYVNGQLFAEQLAFAEFNSDQRNALRSCTRFDWSRISPAIFGALFQEVMTDKERRHVGAHYTSERDILKLIGPLFMDRLREEFETIKADRSGRGPRRLDELRERLSKLRFLDPACGCGNFLVIAYRELRNLELDILLQQHGRQQALTLDEVNRLSTVDVNQFYGIELYEWPARIAEVALWLMDHQSNMRIHEAFGQPFLRLPLRNSPHILQANALRMDWDDLLPRQECWYVLGNPPFVGAMWMSASQHEDVRSAAPDLKGVGILDYVCGWYFKAAGYIQQTDIRVGFVSTNSISQGEQAGVLWSYLYSRYAIKINFAYRTFEWESEARGKAHVHVIIVGFAKTGDPVRRLYDEEVKGQERTFRDVANISPYLVEGPDRVITNRLTPICSVPQMRWGSQPRDGGHFVINREQLEEFRLREPGALKWTRRYVGGSEFINGTERWCLWLVGISPKELNQLPMVKERVAGVQRSRAASKAGSTKRMASTPTLFAQIAQPNVDYLAIPEVSSEKRTYIPMAFLHKDIICSNKIQFIPDASMFHFGVLTSAMHMAWMRRVAGRLESRYSYSNSLVYNNFPWPVQATEAQRARVEAQAQAVLDARARYPDSTLGEFYDPLLMPADLLRAHQQLDRAVERCYRREPFASDQARVEFLFAAYEQLAAPLLPAAKKRGAKARV